MVGVIDSYTADPSTPPRVRPTRLIGRETEVAYLKRVLASHGERLITLTGPAGTGKTRLALEVFDALCGEFDQCVAVDLAPVRLADLVPNTIAHALGVVAASEAASIAARLGRVLRDRRLLLLVDNCEHVLDGLQFVEGLLHACPTLVILATSREPLRIRDEREHPVPPLAVPECAAAPNLEEVRQTAAVALFLERVRSSRPAFALTEENAPAIAELCIRLDGLPLAIELAAARMTVLSPAALLARLDQRFTLLRTRGPDFPPRHRSLRAALDSSFELLSASEQMLFRRLGIFGGAFDLAAAEAVADGPVRDDLDSLVDKSLVQHLISESGEPRFRLLETVRLYARERLGESGETLATGRRHAAYYAALVERLRRCLRGGHQDQCLKQLDREYDDISTALRRLARDQQSQVLLQIAGGLWEYWWVRGRAREGYDWLVRALEGGDTSPSPERARALHGAGLLGNLCGRPGDAWDWLMQSEATWRALDEPDGLAHVLADQAMHLDIGGAHPAAGLAKAREAVDTASEGRDPWVRAYAFFSLAFPLRTAEGDPAGICALDRGEAIFEQLGDQRGVAYTRLRLAEILVSRGDGVNAAHHALLALDTFENLGDTWGLAFALVILAHASARLGRPARSAWVVGQMEAVCAASGITLLPSHQAEATGTLTSAARRLGAARATTARARGYAADRRQALSCLQTSEWSAEAAPGDTVPTLPTDFRTLTEREREIAALVSDGFSNREIAARLAISQRTVEGHVERVRNRFGLRSRSALAAWVVTQQPLNASRLLVEQPTLSR